MNEYTVFNDAVDDCIKVVHDYFCKCLASCPQWDEQSADDFALIPNKGICKELENLKKYKKGETYLS